MIIFLKGALKILDFQIDHMSENVEDAVIMDLNEKDWTEKLVALDPSINSDTIVITFNNFGIKIHVDNQLYWEKKQVKFYNFMVDPPQCFPEVLEMRMKNMTIIVVDRMHCDYIHQYYPEQKCMFIPLGGIRLKEKAIPFSDREMEVVYFGGNKGYFPMDELEQMIYNLLIKFPNMIPDKILDLFLEDQGISLDPENKNAILTKLYKNVFFNIKRFFQFKIIEEIANAGIDLHIYGGGWDEVADQFPDNVTFHGLVAPEDCPRIMQKAKISLNVQPWFKNGPHDRVFNAMINESISLTDESIYLKERFHDMEDIVFYQLEHLDELPGKIKTILDHPDLAESIIERQRMASNGDTWRDRLDEILEYDRFIRNDVE